MADFQGYIEAQTESVILTALAPSLQNEEYINHAILPLLKSASRRGQIVKQAANDMFDYYAAFTSYRGAVEEISPKFTTISYTVGTRGLQAVVTPEEIEESVARNGSMFNLKQRKLAHLVNAMGLGREAVVAAQLFDQTNAAIYTATVNTTDINTTSTAWSSDTAKPIKDILLAKDKIIGKSSMNKIGIAFGADAWTIFRTHPNVLAAFQGSVGGAFVRENAAEGPIPNSDLLIAASLLGVDRVVVGRARVKDSTGTLVRLWGTKVLIYLYLDEGVTETDASAFGSTFWSGTAPQRVYDFPDQKIGPDGGQIIKVAESQSPTVWETKAAHLLFDLT